MRDRSSRTAEHVALFRALESARGGPRVFVDPYAVRLLPLRYWVIIRLARLPAIGHAIGRRVERYVDGRWTAGPRACVVARTKLIDDLVTAAVADGAGQVLLLGVGHDSHFVPVDLLRDDLAEALRRAGLDGMQCTVVVWEGVTNYLTAQMVDATLRDLASTLGASSRIIFTYIDRAALEDADQFVGLDEWHASVREAGEPWTFGLHPDELHTFLAERGMTLGVDLSARDAADR